MVRQAARDLRYSHKSRAMDALEFLRDTGLWLLTDLFGVNEREAQREIVALIFRRGRLLGDDESLVKHLRN